MTDEISDIGDDLRILKITRQAAGNGTWVKGTVAGHRFEALVFQGHADDPEWELGQIQISKLWIKRIETNREVFNWDRGQMYLRRTIPHTRSWISSLRDWRT